MGDRLVNIRGLFACTGCNILMVEYRGYGTSSGEPSEDGLKLDAQVHDLLHIFFLVWPVNSPACDVLTFVSFGAEFCGEWRCFQAALDYLHEREDIDSRQIFAFGRSLGGAVAIWLGHRNPRGLRGVMVENSFTSICEMALPIFPFLQVLPAPLMEMLLSSHWDSLSIVGKLTMPVLFLAGESDEVVPHEQMLQLHQEHRDGCGGKSDDCDGGQKRDAPERSTLVTFVGGRHNETWMLSEYYGHIEAWLGTFSMPPPLADKMKDSSGGGSSGSGSS